MPPPLPAATPLRPGRLIHLIFSMTAQQAPEKGSKSHDAALYPKESGVFSPYRGRVEKMLFGTLSGFADAFHASDSLAGRFRLDPYVVVPNHSPGAQGPTICAQRVPQWIGEQVVLVGTRESRPQSLTRLAPRIVSFWNAISAFRLTTACFGTIYCPKSRHAICTSLVAE